MCFDGKEINLKLRKTPRVGEPKLNLVLMDQMKNEHKMEVVQLEELQRTYGEARKNGPPSNHIRGILASYNDELTNGCSMRD
jgi:hypothetical protein